MRGRRFPHQTVATGGTFDILHKGHERLLSAAFDLGKTVYIGITSDELVSELRKNHSVKPYSSRVRKLRSFLKSRGWLKRARIVELKDPFGPSASRRDLEALVVSQDTEPNGRKANSLRLRQGLPPLRLYVVDLMKAEDGKPISASRIRRAEIDEEGKLAHARVSFARTKHRAFAG
ncbi:phosphopantetheine adenylyltransferase [Candidatus Bathyarchaeota archaeon]|nr:phosphopantetheine adenylyltransferase [Candidatus Bathyarchaeota archaeon]